MTKKTETTETAVATQVKESENLPAASDKATLGLIQASLNKNWKDVDMPTRVRFVARLCTQLNISPVLNPFRFVDMKGVTVLYADKRAAALIGNANKVSTEITKEEYDEKRQILKIYVRAQKPDGTFSDEFAALHLGSNAGEMRANLEMKCLTKAKRRAILALVDLSIPDEDELEYLETAALQNNPYKGMAQEQLGEEIVKVSRESLAPKTIDIVEKEDVDEARLELFDKILEGDNTKRDFMNQFIASQTDGKKLSQLTYDECKSVGKAYDEVKTEVEERLEKKEEAPKQSDDNFDPDLENQEEMFPSSEKNSGL